MVSRETETLDIRNAFYIALYGMGTSFKVAEDVCLGFQEALTDGFGLEFKSEVLVSGGVFRDEDFAEGTFPQFLNGVVFVEDEFREKGVGWVLVHFMILCL